MTPEKKLSLMIRVAVTLSCVGLLMMLVGLIGKLSNWHE